MSRETENIFKDLQSFLDGQEIASEADLDKVIGSFMQNYNGSLHQDAPDFVPETAEDFLRMAEKSNDPKEVLKYARKAAKLDPENLDAARMVAVLGANGEFSILKRLEKLLKTGNAQMEKGNYFEEDMGNFWLVLETRPYMRLLSELLDVYRHFGMIVKAQELGERMLELCTGDNLGVRYTLMNLYAETASSEKAESLYQKFSDYPDAQLLLPFALTYFRSGDLKFAKKQLIAANKANKDLRKFLSLFLDDALDEYLNTISPFGYTPGTIEELVTELADNTELYISNLSFFQWAEETLWKD